MKQIHGLTAQDIKLTEEIDLAWWHEYWREVIDANLDAQA
jgi:hypothetical protein